MRRGRLQSARSCLREAKERLKYPAGLRRALREGFERMASFVRNMPYKCYLKVVFPSGRWRRYYRHEVNEYSATTEWEDAQVQHRELLGHLPGECRRVLDLGCGDGWSSNYISEVLGLDAVGLTCNPDELRFARRRYPGVRVKFGDMHSLPFRDKEFDAVYCRETYEHSIAPYIAMCEMNRVLKEGGYLLINVPDESWLSDESHYSVLTRPQMLEMFRKCRFEPVSEGRTQAGHFWYLAGKTGDV